MRTVAPTLLSLALMVPTVTQTPSAGRGDEAAIRRVVERHDAARNREDWKALGQLFREDAEQLTSAGEWRRGRAAIEKGVAQTMAGAYKGGTYVTKVEAVRMLVPTVALVDGAFEIANIGTGGSRRGYTTYVLVKANDDAGWQIAAARSMVPTPVGSTPPR